MAEKYLLKMCEKSSKKLVERATAASRGWRARRKRGQLPASFRRTGESCGEMTATIEEGEEEEASTLTAVGGK